MKRADANARETAPIPTHIRTRPVGADLPQRAPIRWWKETILKSPVPDVHHGTTWTERQAFAVLDIDADPRSTQAVDHLRKLSPGGAHFHSPAVTQSAPAKN